MTLSRSVKWIIAVVIALLVYWGIDVPTDLADPKTPLFLAITVGTVVVWAFELMPAAAAGVGMLFLYALFVVPPKVAFATFNTFLPWITFSSLIIADALLNSGLGKRIALRSMLLLGSSYSKTMIGLMLSGFVVVLLVPALLARVVIYMAIAQGLVAALDVDPKSRTSSSLIFGGFLAAVAPSLFILTGSEINLMGMYSTWDVTGEPKPWTDFLVQMGPLNVLYMAFSTFMIFMIRGKDPLPGENNLENILRVRLAEMGNIKPSEVKVLVLLVVGLLAFIFEKQIGYPGTMVYSLIMLLAFLPGVDLCDGKSFSKLNLSFVFFLASCQAIGMVAGALHVDKWLSDLMLPLLQGQGNTMAVLITYLSGLLINFLLTPMAATGSMCGPLAQLALQLGIDPQVLTYSFLYGLEQYVLPYEIGVFMYIFVTGAITHKHVVPALALRMVFVPIMLAVVAVPYWTFLGLLK